MRSQEGSEQDRQIFAKMAGIQDPSRPKGGENAPGQAGAYEAAEHIPTPGDGGADWQWSESIRQSYTPDQVMGVNGTGFEGNGRFQFQGPNGDWHDVISWKGNFSRYISILDPEVREDALRDLGETLKGILLANFGRERIDTHHQGTGTLLASVRNAKVEPQSIQSGRPGEGHGGFQVVVQLSNETRPARYKGDKTAETDYYGPRVFFGRAEVRPVLSTSLHFEVDGRRVYTKRARAARPHNIFVLTEDQIDQLANQLRDRIMDAMEKQGYATRQGPMPGPA
jgi:hypothetical protein